MIHPQCYQVTVCDTYTDVALCTIPQLAEESSTHTLPAFLRPQTLLLCTMATAFSLSARENSLKAYSQEIPTCHGPGANLLL